MSSLKITDFISYRYRYIVSYVAIGLLSVALLYITGFRIPGGLSEVEMTAATKSGNLALGALIGSQPDSILFLPYKMAQAASIHLFGVSAVSIKLPSLLLAAASVLLFYKIIQIWFKRNVAIITSVLLVTSTQFLLQSQLGTSGILYLFWGVVLLFTTSMMAHAEKWRSLWFIISVIVVGTSLYSPFALYAVIPLLLTVALHPHARFIVMKQPLWVFAVALMSFIVVTLPLTITAINHPVIIAQLLLGTAIAEGSYDVTSAIPQLLQYVDFYADHNGRILQPTYGLGLVLIALVGVYSLFSAKYTAKSYIITIWALLTIPIIVLYPTYASFSILPIMLLVAFGINYLIRKWYRMFPFNPYARIAGLFPLGVLVIGLALSGLDRFTYGYTYNSDAVRAYSNDLHLINSEVNRLASQSDDEINLLVASRYVSFYQLYARHNTNAVSINVYAPTGPKSKIVERTIVHHSVLEVVEEKVPNTIVVSSLSSESNRLYVFEKTQE